MQIVIWILLLACVPAIALWVWQLSTTRSGIHSRLRDSGGSNETPTGEPGFDDPSLGGVQGWLFRAGFRSPSAVIVFWLSTLLLFVLGCLVWVRLYRTGTIDFAIEFIRSIPGGVGNVMVPFALAMPWFVVAVMALVPTLVVRSVRRKRVSQIEQDLPLLLDLLNTLSQAGVGFDAGLDRVLSASDPERPLTQEMRLFQADNLAGRSRIDSLRRLMRRIEIPIFSTFISAVVQAEQIGAGMGETLRVQAKEMRARRREKATAAAMAVPTLLVVPMVVGFLPGIFVVLLGPMVFQAFGAMGQTLRGVTGQ